MKKFFEDYKNLCKQTGQFYKDHWFGTIVICTVSGVVSFGTVYAINKIIEKKEEKEYEKMLEKYENL